MMKRRIVCGVNCWERKIVTAKAPEKIAIETLTVTQSRVVRKKRREAGGSRRIA